PTTAIDTLSLHDALPICVCPVVRFANQLDLEGRTPGEVEPFIPIMGRIDQTTFDRLLIQRHASWKVRTVSGMTLPDEDEAQYRADRKSTRLNSSHVKISY